ncbi:MAG: hypothetical protein ACRYFX_12300 [Janthinobacterium lividum]
MRAFSLPALIFLLLLPQWSLAQQLDAKVDSVFMKHFAGITEKVRAEKNLTSEEVAFAYVVSFLSGLNIGTIQCYGPLKMTEQDIVKATKWYTTHRSQITWERLQRGFTLMRTIRLFANDAEEESYFKALDSLRIK